MYEYDPNNFIYARYVRKSEEAAEKQIQSIGRQKDDLYEIVERDNLEVYGEIIEETQSAFLPGRGRFQFLVDITEQGYANAWLCWHPNRLSRNAVDSGIIVDLMDRGKLHHIRTPSRIYFNTPTDKLLLQFEFILSKKDSDDKSVFVKSGLKKRYKKGYPTGKAVTGFLNDKTKEKGDRGWIVDSKRFKKVEKIFNRFLKGRDSITTIHDYAVNNLKLTTSSQNNIGGRPISRSLIETLLKNPIYAGFFYSMNEDSKGRTRRELDQSLPRIISEKQHEKILQILGKRGHEKLQEHDPIYTHFIVGRRDQRIGADLKFQLICDCGHKFAYRSKDNCPKCSLKISKMNRPKYLSYTYYYNIQLRKTKGKIAKCVEEKKVDTYLVNYLKNHFTITDEVCRWAKRHISELKDRTFEEHNIQMQIFNKESKGLAQEKEELRKMRTKHLITEEEFITDNEEISKKQQELELKNNDFEDYFIELEGLFDLAVEFEEIIENGSHKEKKHVLQQFGSNLIWNEEKLEIIRPKWLKVYENGRKRILAKKELFEPRNNVENKRSKVDSGPLCPEMLRWLDEIRTCMLNENYKTI